MEQLWWNMFKFYPQQSKVAGQWSSCNSYCTSVPQTLVFEPKVAKKKYLIEILIWITLIASPLMISVRYCTIIWPNRLGYIYFQNLTNCSFQVTLLIMWMGYFESNQIFKQDCWSGSKIYVESHSGFLLSPKTEISSQHTAAKEEPKAQISGKENTASIIYVWLLVTVLYSSFF